MDKGAGPEEDERVFKSMDVSRLTVSAQSHQETFKDDPEDQKRGKVLPESQDESFGGLRSQKDLAHWSYFGRKGTVQPTRSTRMSWKQNKSFQNPRTISWNLALSAPQLSRLLHGFYPVEMEDKWYIYADGPYADGSAKVNFLRSWTGTRVAEIDLKILWGEDDAKDTWDGRIVRLTYDGSDGRSSDEDNQGQLIKTNVTEAGHPREEAKPNAEEEDDEEEELTIYLVLEACRWVLGVKLVDEIKEPRSWTRLSKSPIEKPSQDNHEQVTTTYRGTSVSKETYEDLQRFGVSSVPIQFT